MDFPARLPIPDAVLRIAKQLEGAGYETWCVGGAIRDNLLKVENHDFDLTTAAPPDEVRRLFKRTVPVGIEHGTVAVLDQKNRQHENRQGDTCAAVSPEAPPGQAPPGPRGAGGSDSL